MKLKNIPDFIADLILASLMGLSIVYALTYSLHLAYSPFLIFAIITAIMVIFSVVLLNRLSVLISAAVLGLALISGFIYFMYAKHLDRLAYEVLSYSNWLYEYIEIGTRLDSFYELVTVLLLCVPVSIFMYVFTHKKPAFIPVLAAGASVFVAQWMTEYFMSYFSFYLFVAVILIYYFRHIYRKKSNTEDGEYIRNWVFVTGVAPVCVIIFLFALSIPEKEKPIEWKWLDTKINQVYNYFTSNYTYEVFEYFSVAESGFGDGYDRLGGRVRLNNRITLTVESPRHIYLKGSAKEIYTGSAWLNRTNELLPYDEGSSGLYRDVYEMQNGSKLLFDGYDSTEDFYFKDNIKVTYENLKTKSLFYPVKTYFMLMSGTGYQDMLIDANSGLSSKEVLSKGYSYSLDAYTLKLSDENLTNALRKSRRGLYRTILDAIPEDAAPGVSADGAPAHFTVTTKDGRKIELVDEVSGRGVIVSSQGLFNSDLFKYDDLVKLSENSDSVYRKYLQLPENLPARVKELAASITRDHDTDYDKAKAIEQYLAANYPYTLNVKPVPKGRDFTDYFLFDVKEGYCTYYATAMTVLLRCAGIPSRYVEGYILPPSPETGTKYKVTNEQAHAWAEVYFEGFGWVPFEPTSPFVASFYNFETNAQAYMSDNFMYDPLYFDYLQRMRDYGNENIDLSAIRPDESELAKSRQLRLIVALSALAVMLLVLIIVILVNNIRHRLTLYSIRNMPPRESVLAMTARFLKLLSLQGFKINPGETPLEYAARVGNTYLNDYTVVMIDDDPGLSVQPSEFSFKKKESEFLQIMDIFTVSKYSKKDISEESKQKVFNYHRYIYKKTRRTLGRIKYFVYKSLLGKI